MRRIIISRAARTFRAALMLTFRLARTKCIMRHCSHNSSRLTSSNIPRQFNLHNLSSLTVSHSGAARKTTKGSNCFRLLLYVPHDLHSKPPTDINTCIISQFHPKVNIMLGNFSYFIANPFFKNKSLLKGN